MSGWSDTSAEDRRREERREYERDVWYEVWRSGRDPDRIDPDRVSEHYWAGDPSDSAAAHEIRAQRDAEQRRMDQAAEEADQLRQAEEDYYRGQMEGGQEEPPAPEPPPAPPAP